MTEVKDEIPVAKKAPAAKTTRAKKTTAKVPAKSSTSKIKIISDSRTLSAE